MKNTSEVYAAQGEGSGQAGMMDGVKSGARDAFSISRIIIDAIILLVMLFLPFAGIALSDIEAGITWPYWHLVAVAYFVGALGLAILHRSEDFRLMPSIVRLAIHWLGVLGAVHGMFYFVNTDHLTDGQAGLVLGLLLALAIFLCGVYVQWRMIVVGIAVLLATIVEAVVEENLWILLGITLLMLVVVLVTQRLRHSFARGR